LNFLFTIIADGRIVGTTAAPCDIEALAQAQRGLSRQTQSKDSEACDYTTVTVTLLNPAATPSPALHFL
jgi:hypothetical protein